MSISKMIPHSRAAEVDFAAKRILEACVKAKISNDPHFFSLVATLTSTSAALAAAIDLSKSESTLEEFDAIRDSAFTNLHGLTFGYTHHGEPAIAEAAKEIFAVLDKHGRSVVQEPYAIESAHLDAMLLQLAEPDMQAAAANLSGFAPLFAKLKADEAAFGEAYTAWKAQKASEKTQAPSTELKKVVVKLLNDEVILYLAAMAQAKPPQYSALAQTVAQIIADSNSAVSRRRSGEKRETTAGSVGA